MKELTNFITLSRSRKASLTIEKIAKEVGITTRSVYHVINNRSGKKVVIDGKKNIFTHDPVRTKIYKILSDNQKVI